MTKQRVLIIGCHGAQAAHPTGTEEIILTLLNVSLHYYFFYDYYYSLVELNFVLSLCFLTERAQPSQTRKFVSKPTLIVFHLIVTNTQESLDINLHQQQNTYIFSSSTDRGQGIGTLLN